MGQSRTKVDREEGSGFDGLTPANVTCGWESAHKGEGREEGRDGVFLAALRLVGPGSNSAEGFQKAPLTWGGK